MEKENKDKVKKIEKVEGGKSINDLIDGVNKIEADFNKDFKTPLEKQQKDSLKVCLLDKTPGSDIKVAYMGAILAMIASSPNMTKEDLQKQFSITKEAPYIEVKVVDKWEPTFTSLQEWIQLYIDKV